MATRRILVLVFSMMVNVGLSLAQSEGLTTVAILRTDGIILPFIVKSDTSWRPASEEDYQRIKLRGPLWYMLRTSGDSLAFNTGTPVIFEDDLGGLGTQTGKGFLVSPFGLAQKFDSHFLFDAPVAFEKWISSSDSVKADYSMWIHDRVTEEESRILENEKLGLHYDSVTVVAGVPGIPADETLRDSVEMKIDYLYSMENVPGIDQVIYLRASRRYPYYCGSVVKLEGWLLKKEGEYYDDTVFSLGDCDGKGLGDYITPVGSFINDGSLYIISFFHGHEWGEYMLFEVRNGKVTKVFEP